MQTALRILPTTLPKGTMSIHRTTPTAPPSLVTTDKYIFFYGYELQIPELTFQQWYPASFDETIDGKTIRFPTGEHYMTYRKALAMSDRASASRILDARTPLEANKLGRAIRNYDGELWRREREGVAEQGNWLKFSQVEECRAALLGSGNKVIVEASPTDRIWGIGFAGDQAEGREEEWGENILGQALMRVRERLRREEKEKEKEGRL